MHPYLIEKIILYLFILLPISIIIGVFVSSIIILIICLLFLFFSYKNNYWKWLNEKYIKLFLFLYLYLIFNSFVADDFSISALRNFGFLRFIIFVAAIQYCLNNEKNTKLLLNSWLIILSIFCVDVYIEFIFQQNYRCPNYCLVKRKD